MLLKGLLKKFIEFKKKLKTMPRTKLPKVGASKRARENNSELDDILRDYDVECKFLSIKNDFKY